MIRSNKYLFSWSVALTALILLLGSLWYFFVTPDDAINVRKLYNDDEQLSYIRKIEEQNGTVSSNISSNRKYIRIYIDKKNCVWAIFDPPIPVNGDDDVYCFDKSDGKYLGKL